MERWTKELAEFFWKDKGPLMLLWFLMKASACNFTKSNTSPCVFFTFFLNWTNSIKSRKALHIKEKLNVWRTQNLTEKDMIYICFYSKKTLGQEMHFWNNYFLGKSSIPRDTLPVFNGHGYFFILKHKNVMESSQKKSTTKSAGVLGTPVNI